MTKKSSTPIVSVNNQVVNYQQAHAGARSIKVAAGTLNQARKSLGGIADEPIAIGRDSKRNKVYTTVGSFMASVGCPYEKGQVALSAIKSAWADYLKDSEGRMLLCRNVNQRIKIGKQNYLLYHADENGKMKPVSVYQPTPVRDNGWDPYRICEGLAQSKFIDETIVACTLSMGEFERMRQSHELFVLDSLTGDYIPVKENGTKLTKQPTLPTRTMEAAMQSANAPANSQKQMVMAV